MKVIDPGHSDIRVPTELERILRASFDAEYKRGYRDGLAVARTIRGWLTRQPDRKWQAETRLLVDREIARAERECL